MLFKDLLKHFPELHWPEILPGSELAAVCLQHTQELFLLVGQIGAFLFHSGCVLLNANKSIMFV